MSNLAGAIGIFRFPNLIKALALAVVVKILHCYWEWRKIIVLSKLLSAKYPLAPVPMSILGALPVMIRNFSHILHFRTHLFEEVAKNFGRDKKTMQVWPLLWDPLFVLWSKDPVIVKHILKDRFEVYNKPTNLKAILGDFLGHGIFVADHGPYADDKGSSWLLQRKTASKIFTRNVFNGHVYATLLKNCDKLISNINKHISQQGKISKDTSIQLGFFPMKQQIYAFTLDSIGDIGFGLDLDTLNHDGVVPFSTAFDKTVQLITLRDLSPGWRWFKYVYPTEIMLKFQLRTLNSFCDKVIKERLADKTVCERGDILSLFIEAGFNTDQRFLRDVIMSFMIAGRDTTACTLSFAFFLLSTHLNVQEYLYTEIVTVFKDKQLNIQTDRVNLEMLESMPYLAAVVLETLRLFPPVPVDVKHAATDDILPDGTEIKKGSIITYEVFCMGYDPEAYPEPFSFKPERWLDEERKTVKQYDQFEFPVFQAGPRFCLGKDLAAFEVKVVLVELIKKFKFLFSEEEIVGKLDLKKRVMYTPGITLSYKGDLDLKIFHRNV